MESLPNNKDHREEKPDDGLLQPLLFNVLSDVSKTGSNPFDSNDRQLGLNSVVAALPAARGFSSSIKKSTFGRIIANRLKHKNWYNPGKNQNNHPLRKYSERTEAHQLEASSVDGYTLHCRPTIDKGWEYFEYVTLSRHRNAGSVNPDSPSLWEYLVTGIRTNILGDEIGKLNFVEPGSHSFDSKLYSPVYTSLSQLGDFGLGIGLYMLVVRTAMVFLLFSFLLSVPNYLYFRSNEYSDGQLGVSFVMKGSAICTRVQLVPCPTCDLKVFKKDRIPDKLIVGTLLDSQTQAGSESPSTLTFALKNECNGATLTQGLVNLLVSILFIVYAIYLKKYREDKEIELDADEQTARDYSIQISNPPKDASDPETWKQFFEKFDGVKVACCTIAVSNDFLLRTLLERKELFYRLEMMLAPGTPIDEISLARIAADLETRMSYTEYVISEVFRTLGFKFNVPSLYDRLVVLDSKIRGLAQLDHPVTEIYITFQTEKMKEDILSRFSPGRIKILKNDTADEYAETLFQGKILDVAGAEEPSTVRWTDLNASFLLKTRGALISAACTLLTICGAFVLVVYVDENIPFLTPYVLSIYNFASAQLGRLYSSMQSFTSESEKQVSVFLKSFIFLMLNTAVLVSIISPFGSYINSGETQLLPLVYKLIFIDAISTIAIQLCDPIGHFKRHYLAPRASNQEHMFTHFQGSYYSMSDRYTNMWKILSMAIFYGPIFPQVYLFGGICLLMFSVADKVSLMRTWYRAPKFGPTISIYSANLMAWIAIIFMVFMTSLFFSGFPFDSLCENGQIGNNFNGTYIFDQDQTAAKVSNTTFLNINGTSIEYKYCSQFGIPAFPSSQPNNAEWMSNEQKLVCNIYGSLTILIIFGSILRVLIWFVPEFLRELHGGYEKKAEENLSPISYSAHLNLHEDQDKKLGNPSIESSEVPTLNVDNAYIPAVRSSLFPFPLLACPNDCGLLREDSLLSSDDDQRPKGYFNLVNDALLLLQNPNRPGLIRKNTKVFSTFKYWGEDE